MCAKQMSTVEWIFSAKSQYLKLFNCVPKLNYSNHLTVRKLFEPFDCMQINEY